MSIEAASKRVEERLRELERRKEEFAALVSSVEQAAQRDVEHLISMYTKMKPKAAGALFAAMEPSFAAGFLSRMRPDKASAILANMSPERAYAISVTIAGRNLDPLEE